MASGEEQSKGMPARWRIMIGLTLGIINKQCQLSAGRQEFSLQKLCTFVLTASQSFKLREKHLMKYVGKREYREYEVAVKSVACQRT